MNKIKNTNKGITLIALIITIIVMLILVSVTITMAVNGGLFNYAQKAVGETKNAIDKEQELANGGLNIAGTWYNSIDEYLGTETITETHSWTRSGDTFTCSHCEESYTMGEVVNYTPAGKTSTTITAAMSGLDKYYAKNSGYPLNTNVNTTTGAQTIEAQDATWIILGMEDTNGNGTNETLLITTQEPVTVNSAGKYLAFYGAVGYNNGPEEIKRICEELYSNSTYGQARGMTIEDVNMVLGYTPTTAYYYDGSNYVATGNLTTKLKDLEIFEAMVEDGISTPDGKNAEATLGEYELNAYSYSLKGTNYLTLKDIYGGTDIKTITETERNTIFGASRNYDYWLANRGVYAQTYGTTYAYFGPGYVDGGKANSYHDLFYSDGTEINSVCGLRPVVSLISKLPTVK